MAQVRLLDLVVGVLDAPYLVETPRGEVWLAEAELEAL